MTSPSSLADDEERFRELGQALADAIERELAGWVEAKVAVFWVDGPPTHVAKRASEAGANAVDEVAPKIRELLALDIDRQWTNPLTLLRTATRYPTEILKGEQIPPVQRDATAEKFHPDDVYDLTPGGFGDLGTDVGQAGLIWGAAKAHVHLRRRRPPSETEPQ